MALPGIPDEEFLRGKVPMTKQEIRALTMVKAQIKSTDIVLDIGAGTGSLSVEAACLASEGKVFSIEKNPEGVELIGKNAEKFGVTNIEIIENVAPRGMEDLPSLDVVIIGGSGKNLDDILDRVTELLKPQGKIVLNCITIQTLSSCLEYMRKHKDIYKYEAIQVQVNRLEQIGPYDMAKAINPIYIVTCEKISGRNY